MFHSLKFKSRWIRGFEICFDKITKWICLFQQNTDLNNAPNIYLYLTESTELN